MGVPSWEDSMSLFTFTHLTAVKQIKRKLQKPELHKLPAPTDMVRWYKARSLRYFRAITKCTPRHPRRSADVANYVCSLTPRTA